jgi:hypothetical protein
VILKRKSGNWDRYVGTLDLSPQRRSLIKNAIVEGFAHRQYNSRPCAFGREADE